MTIDNLEKELKMGKLNSIYLLYGEELLLLENFLKKIKGLFGECVKGINYILIDEQNVSEIIDDIETPSFGYEKKLIIAKNTGLFKKEGKKKSGDLYKLKEKLINYINENLKVIDEAVVLVFTEEEADEKSDLLKTIDKCGVTCKFDFQKPAHPAGLRGGGQSGWRRLHRAGLSGEADPLPGTGTDDDPANFYPLIC